MEKSRIFIEDRDRAITAVKKPRVTISQIFENMFYQIRDAQTGRVIIPFDYVGNSTKLSSDSVGMYFHFYMDALPAGRTYTIEFLIRDFDDDYFVTDSIARFSVE